LTDQSTGSSPRSPLAHYAKGQVLRVERRFAEAIPEYETALSLNPSFVVAFHHLGQCKLFSGAIEETIPLVEKAIRLSPRDPELGLYFYEIGRVHLLLSHIDEAILWLEKARNAGASYSSRHAMLASAYALRGDTEHAAAELAEARKRTNDDRYSSLARLCKWPSRPVMPWCRKCASCSKPLISSACERPGCRRNDGSVLRERTEKRSTCAAYRPLAGRPLPAPLARCRVLRRRSPDLTESGRPAGRRELLNLPRSRPSPRREDRLGQAAKQTFARAVRSLIRCP
jgi:tetratricopeptide (TPR) repeat protein